MKGKNGLVIIIVAALLLQIISIVQYFSSRNILGEELEYRAESELTMKAIIVKGMLNQTQAILNNYDCSIRQHLSDANSMFDIVETQTRENPILTGSWIGFRPGYYSQKDSLFEPYAKRQGDSIYSYQVAGSNHDYSKKDLYVEPVKSDDFYWTNPYIDKDGTEMMVTTCSMPIYDDSGNLACVSGADLSLSWLNDTLDYRHMYPSTFVVLMTEDGIPISTPSSSANKANDASQVVSLINDSTVERRYSISGRSKLLKFRGEESGNDAIAFYTNMKGKPHWQICVVCYENEAFSSLNRLFWYILLLNVFAICVLLFIIMRYAREQRILNESKTRQTYIDSQLQIASNIQSSILPNTALSDESVDIGSTLVPAKQVGGDLYDFSIRNEKLFFCIGDVSGKGIPSALIMAMTEAIFRAVSSNESNPSRIMKSLNAIACRNNHTNMFSTIFVGVLDLPTGHLRYCNAGHDLPILIGNDLQTLPATAHLPVGVFDTVKYKSQEIVLSPGTSIFLYTDGLTEARNKSRELYGLDRVHSSLKGLDSGMSAQQMVDKVLSDVTLFMDNTEHSDDLTMLAIKYKGQTISSELLTDRIELDNDVNQVTSLNSFVVGFATRAGLSKPLVSQMKLAVEEAVVNAMSYAYAPDQKGKIELSASYDGERMKFVLTDYGTPFDPTTCPMADTTLSVADRPIGGLGLLLVRELMDSVNYEYVHQTDGQGNKTGRNVLTMKKIIKS